MAPIGTVCMDRNDRYTRRCFLFICSIFFSISMAMTQTPEIEPIRRNLPAADARFANYLSDPMTRLKRLETPWLPEVGIFLADHLSPERPIRFYLAVGPENYARVITGRFDLWEELMLKGEAQIDNLRHAESFLRTWLEVTADPSLLSYLIASVDEIRFRPHLDEDDEAHRQEVIDKFRGHITDVQVSNRGRLFKLTCFLMRGHELQEVSLQLLDNGTVENLSVEILDRDLPVVYGL